MNLNCTLARRWSLGTWYDITKRLGLVEAYRELRGSLPKTFPVWLHIMPLDRVYFRGIEAISAETLTGSPWNRLSDHAPLCVEYALKWD